MSHQGIRDRRKRERHTARLLMVGGILMFLVSVSLPLLTAWTRLRPSWELYLLGLVIAVTGLIATERRRYKTVVTASGRTFSRASTLFILSILVLGGLWIVSV